MLHALAIAPAKSKHQILLEFSKVGFLGKRPSVAYSLLLHAIRSYPEEWKLELEYLQQKVRESSPSHVGAGGPRPGGAGYELRVGAAPRRRGTSVVRLHPPRAQVRSRGP